VAVPFTEVASLAFDKHLGVLRDNIFTGTPALLYFLGKKEGWLPQVGMGGGRHGADYIQGAVFQKPEPRLLDGGVQLEESLVYAANTNLGSYAGADTLSYGAEEQVTKAQYPWCEFYCDITVTNRELRQCSGKPAIFNLIETKRAAAINSLYENVSAQLFSDGTGTGGDDIDGILLMIDPAGGGDGAYGGITETWWESPITDLSSATTTVDDIRGMIRDCSVRNDRPTLAITTEDIYENIEKAFPPHMRYDGGKSHRVLDFYNFEHIVVNGVPLVYDADCQANRVYVVDTKVAGLKMHKDEYFRLEKIAKPIDANLHNWKIFGMGNLTCGARRKQGALINAG
jgi:hypothetical protein